MHNLKRFGILCTCFPQVCSVTELSLQSNHLNGNVPSTLSSMSNLMMIYLSFYSITGTLPSSLDALSQLSYLDLSYNSITGTLPSSLGELSKIICLYLSSNSLSGVLSSSIVKWLSDGMNHGYLFFVSRNKGFSLPDDIASITSLYRYALQLSDCDPVGTIPPSIGNLTYLRMLHLYYNRLKVLFLPLFVSSAR